MAFPAQRRRRNRLSTGAWLACAVFAVAAPARAGPRAAPPDEVDFSVDVEPTRAPQGSVLQVRIRNFQGGGMRSASARFAGARAEGIPWAHGDTLMLLPVGMAQRLGTHDVEVRIPRGGRPDTVLRVPVVVVPGDFETDALGVSRAFLDPTRAQRARAAADARVFDQAWRRSARERLWAGPFMLPVDNAITARFGTFRTLNGRTQSRHRGVDVRGKVGDAVLSSNGGRIIVARDCFYSGNTVVVDHGAGIHTLYFHLDTLRVKTGQRVRRGERLGTVGRTGRVTGPHLHWGVKVAGAYVDGLALLAADLRGDPVLPADAGTQPLDGSPPSTGPTRGADPPGMSSLPPAEEPHAQAVP